MIEAIGDAWIDAAILAALSDTKQRMQSRAFSEIVAYVQNLNASRLPETPDEETIRVRLLLLVAKRLVVPMKNTMDRFHIPV